jgi:hypothetical protein
VATLYEVNVKGEDKDHLTTFCIDDQIKTVTSDVQVRDNRRTHKFLSLACLC